MSKTGIVGTSQKVINKGEDDQRFTVGSRGEGGRLNGGQI